MPTNSKEYQRKYRAKREALGLGDRDRAKAKIYHRETNKIRQQAKQAAREESELRGKPPS